MRRALISAALTACALLPLAARAADEEQVPNQGAAQTPVENQSSSVTYAQIVSPGAAPETPGNLATLPPNRSYLYVTAGLGQTDNVALTATDQHAQTMVSIGTAVDFARQGSFFNGSLKGEVDYLDYLQHYYRGQFNGRLDGDASWWLVEDRFKWVLQDQYGNAQVDALTAPNRNNIQSVNIFSTGPDFIMRPTETFYARLGARYQASDWATSPYNSQRLLGMASVGEDLSVASSVSLNADFTSIRFQDPTVVNPDYQRRKYYLRYDARGMRTNLALDLGYAEANDTGEYKGKPLAQLLLSRDLTPRQSAFISAGQQLTDAADAFSGLTSGAAGYTILAPAAGSGGNYLSQYASAGWQYKATRTTFAVTGRWDRETYTLEATPQQLADYVAQGLPAPLNVERWTVEGRVVRDLTPVIAADVHVSYTHEDYWTIGNQDHFIFAGIAATYLATSRLEYRLRYDYNTRHAQSVPTDATRVVPNYSENTIWLTVAYRVSQ
jgi:hypothetical protein